MKYLQSFKNEIDFFLRKIIKVSKKDYNEINEPKYGLLSTESALHREKILVDKFKLDYLKSNSTRQNYLENLYTIDLLDKYLTIASKESLNIVDIGCKNWFYAKGEYSFFKKYCKNLYFEGYEIDSTRLYNNFYSRGEVAKFHIKTLDGVKYIEKNFLNNEKKFDYIIWILPFVFEEPLLKWGLPLSCFDPEKLLFHAYKSLKENGTIFIINQGEWEYEEQRKLCQKLNLNYLSIGEVKSEFLNYEYGRFLTLVKN